MRDPPVPRRSGSHPGASRRTPKKNYEYDWMPLGLKTGRLVIWRWIQADWWRWIDSDDYKYMMMLRGGGYGAAGLRRAGSAVSPLTQSLSCASHNSLVFSWRPPADRDWSVLGDVRTPSDSPSSRPDALRCVLPIPGGVGGDERSRRMCGRWRIRLGSRLRSPLPEDARWWSVLW